MANLRNIIDLKVIAYIVIEIHATACVCGFIMTHDVARRPCQVPLHTYVYAIKLLMTTLMPDQC